MREIDSAPSRLFAQVGNGGLIVTSARRTSDSPRDTIVALAARHGLPAIYHLRVTLSRVAA